MIKKLNAIVIPGRMLTKAMNLPTINPVVGIFMPRKKVMTWHAEKEKAAEKTRANKENHMRETRARP